jgi:hypothetical protein
VERLEDRTCPTVATITNYNGLNFGQTGAIQGGAAASPPDPQGAVGPNSYVEAVNLSVAIYNPKTSCPTPVTDSLDDFFGAQGNLPDPNPNDLLGNSFTDPQVVFDNQTQRFMVGSMEVDPGPQFGSGFTGDNSSVFDVAVSKTPNPLSVTTADWNFYQVNTTETGYFSDFPGNLGFNGGALVVTLNEFNVNNTNNIDHVLVNAINMSDLTNGVAQANLHVYQTDFQGVSLRPTTMHDSNSANDPMWFVQEHPGSGGLGDGQHIDVVEMTNVLSNNPTFTTTTLAVNPYTDISLTPPLQPDGSVVTPALDSRILKVAQQNNLLVATHSVSVSSTEDDAQWYVIDVSSGTPVLKQQGDVSGGNNTYITYPGIDINPAGDIGMSYMQSGTDSPTDFLSMYVTGRTASDPAGTMETSVVAQAGQQVYQDFGPSQGVDQRAGDLSGINIDSAGNFWAINEFADNEPLPTPDNPSADWGTNIAEFTLNPLADLSVTATGPATVTAGTSATYTLTLINNGPDDAHNVVLSDTLPAGATNASITPVSNPDGFTFTLAGGVFTSAPVTVPNGNQDVFTVTVFVPSSLTPGAVFDDVAQATSSTADPNPYDNASTVIGANGPSVTISTNYNAVNFGQSANLEGGAGSTPPDPEGAVGPNSYIETVNLAVAIFSPQTSGANPTTDSIDHFFGVTGGLPDPNPADFLNFYTDPVVTFDEQTQRFFVSAMEVDPGPQFAAQSTGNNSSVFDVAVSKSANPTTLTTADWNFYQINTTEANEFSDFPGNLGYNGGALVVTLNEFETVDFNQSFSHVLVTSINMSDLVNGVSRANLHVYQTDFQGASLRPTTMHDSTSPNDPMWFVQEHLGADGNPDGQHIDVIKMTNVLSNSPTFTTTTLAVNPYFQVVQPLQPDGSGVTPALDSRILKAAEQGGTLVAAHAVSNAAGNQDLVQWYQIDVSSGTPVLHDQGDVGSGPNTYLYYPGIDINPAGAIGMSYVQSGTDNPNDFMSMYVTGRTSSDPAGTMEAPVLAQAGLQVYEDFAPSFGAPQRAGDLSGINVAADGSFWAINEFADDEALPDANNPVADWGTNVTNFTLPPSAGTSPLVITQLTPPVATEGQPIATFTVATFTDSNPNSNINNLTATVTWGDGHSDTLTAANGGIVVSGNGFAVLDGHTYGEEGSGLTFSVQVVDSAGGSAVTSATINVADAALSVTQLTAPSATEGASTGTLTLARFTDANPNPDITDLSATVNWGDGHSDTLTSANGGIVQNADGSFSVLGAHTYAEEGTGLAFSVQIMDKGGASASTSATLNVTDAALSITQLTAPSATEGVSTGTLTVATFTDANTSPDINDYTATVTWGDGHTDTLTAANGGIVASGSGFAVQAAHAYGEEGSGLTFSVQITDKGGASASTSATISVADAALSITQLTAPSATEGVSTGALTVAKFTDANSNPDITDLSATVNWGDGHTDTLTSANGGIVQNADGSFSVVGTHTYAEEGSNLPFSVQIMDKGGASTSTSATINVADATLTVTQLTAPSATEGVSTGTLTVAKFTDANSNPDITDLSATVNWGDGHSDTLTSANGGIVQNADGSFSVMAAHTYAEEGSNLPFSVQITDKGGASTSTSATISVADAALTVQTLTPPTATEGVSTGTLTLATFTDANTSPDINDYTATVTWGDGHTDTLTAANGGIVASGNGFAVQAGHTFGEEASGLTFSVQLTDTGGASTATSASISVADAGLSITALTAPSATEGVSTGSFTIATFTDANTSPDINDYTATVNWGDGHTDTLTAANGGLIQNADGSFSVVGGHTYAEEGSSLPFSVQITDMGSASTSTSATISVADATLSVTQLTAPSPTEGVSTGTLTVAKFTDANPNPDITDLSATVNWGDGHSDTLTSASGGIVQNADGSFSVVGTHTYAEEGSGLPFSVQISDKGGASTSTSATISVADAALTMQTLTPPAATEGVGTGTLTLATFTDANTSPDSNDYTATVNWGDGHTDTLTAANGGIVASGNGFAAQAGHTYGEEASGLTFSVQLTDAGGASTTTSATINVADAALTITNFSPPTGAVAGVNTGTLTLATFTDANTSPDSKDFTATVSWGDNTSDTLTTANGGIVANADGSFSVKDSHTYAQALTNATFSVQISDAGGSSTSTSATINVAPASGLTLTGQTFSATENAAVTSVTVATFTDSNATSFSATVTWGDNDTTASVQIMPDPIVVGQFDVVASKSHPYAEGGNYSVGVTVTDNNNASASVTSTAAVADLPITASGGVSLKATEGATIKTTTVATFTDADTSEAITSYTATIDWGDGHTSTGTLKATTTAGKFLVQGSHIYADEGNYTVTVSISDTGGATASATDTATVADATLTPTAKKVSPTEGVAFTGTVATFHDNNTKAPASDFTATITWGDRNTSTGTVVATGKGNFAVVGSNTYAEEGTYAVNVSISDDGGKSTSVTSKATVADARLTGKGLTVQATEGNVFSGTVATFTDANGNPDINDFSATIVWGDKQTSAGTIVPDGSGGFAVLGGHTYAEKGTYSMTITIDDAGGASSKVGSTAKVADAPLSGQAVPVNAVHGQPFSGTVATFTDGNPTAPVGDFTATINWGDGHTSTATVVIDPNGGFDVIGDHTYANAGAFAITVNIIDKDGSTLTLKGVANVT